MGKPRSQTTFEDDRYATKLSGGARTVVAHGATAEESEARATQVWDARERQLAEVAHEKVDEGIEIAFEELASSWTTDTAHLSSPAKFLEHPAYRQIIGLGPRVLPLVLNDLSEHRRFWFPALAAITGENPVPDDAAGDTARMREAWLAWGRNNGLI